MHRLRSVILAAGMLLLLSGFRARAAQAEQLQQRTPLFVYLHVLQPLEKQARAAHNAVQDAVAYRLYLRALRHYEALDHAAGDWAGVRPRGLKELVREGLARCDAAVKELRPAAERESALLQRLNQPVNLDVVAMDIRDVAKLLTLLTDVNIFVDDALFPEPGPSPNVTVRADRDVPLIQVIRLLVQQKGLAYAVEEEYVYISSRTRLDSAPGFSTTPWFQPE